MARADDPTRAAGEPGHRRLGMLDGWRALSILLVLAGHQLPLGPKQWGMNGAIAGNGMSIFFALSGFLIVSILLRDGRVWAFAVRRLLRIVPLAWTALLLALPLRDATATEWVRNLSFTANLQPFALLDWTGHFWSLDVEVQFYAAIGLVVLLLGQRGLALVPVAALAVTALRIATGTEASIITWLRVDEILAGGTLALVIHGDPGGRAVRLLARVPFWPVALLFLASTRPELPPLDYLRPYLAAAMVGITILRPVAGASRLLQSRPARYLAAISYAVYVIHPFTTIGWLNSGEGVVRYAKRPLSFAITFALAHVSTFHFERRFIDWSHRLTRAGRPLAPAR